MKDGVIAENDSSYYSPQNGPFFSFAEGITGYASGLTSYVFTPYTMGLKQLDSDNTEVTYTALASTSDSSVLKTDVSNAQTYEKEKGDEDGPFDTVVAASKTITISDGSDEEETTAEENTEEETTADGDTEEEDSDSSETTVTSNLLVFGSVYSLSDTMDELVQGSNTQIVNNALSEYIDTDVTTVSVPAKSLSSTTLTVTESGTRLFGILLAVVAPIVVLAAGIIVWVRRRKY